jgi:cobalt-zinc-cadmium efflux system membrane fusion protein
MVRFGIPLVLVVLVGGVAALKREALMQRWEDFRQTRQKSSVVGTNHETPTSKRPLFELVSGKKETFRLIDKDLANLGINVYTIGNNPPPKKLRLPGTLTFDPNRFIRVHSRFPGEVRRVGKVAGSNRPLQYGDYVSVGDLLATIWSKDIGEKKSELVDAYCRVQFDKINLDRVNSIPEVVAKKQVTEFEKAYQGDVVAALKAERTLRSWNFSEKNIEDVRNEAMQIIELIKKLKAPENIGEKDRSMVQAVIADDDKWAELDILAAQAGVIAEKNFNVGDMIDTTNVLLRIADIDRIQVLANVFEEDVPALRALPPEERKWSLDLKSESVDKEIHGHFDQIGIIVDSQMHTLPVMGYVDNSKKHFAIGQFITATVEIPGDPTQVVIPVAAVVEEGSKSAVFVESNAELREYTRRHVAVISRGRNWVHVSMVPDDYQIERGIEPLHPGERVLINSVVELDAELNDLVSSSKK